MVFEVAGGIAVEAAQVAHDRVVRLVGGGARGVAQDVHEVVRPGLAGEHGDGRGCAPRATERVDGRLEKHAGLVVPAQFDQQGGLARHPERIGVLRVPVLEFGLEAFEVEVPDRPQATLVLQSVADLRVSSREDSGAFDGLLEIGLVLVETGVGDQGQRDIDQGLRGGLRGDVLLHGGVALFHGGEERVPTGAGQLRSDRVEGDFVAPDEFPEPVEPVKGFPFFEGPEHHGLPSLGGHDEADQVFRGNRQPTRIQRPVVRPDGQLRVDGSGQVLVLGARRKGLLRLGRLPGALVEFPE